MEQGPYFVGKDGKLNENPFSWNKQANMLYIEQPAGVGFSYCDTEADKVTGDEQAAADNFQLIRQFLSRFPERQSNDFFISSESYGGHYIPQLALEILKKNTDGLINFKGFLVGNPYVDPLSNTITQFDAYYSHGLLAKPLFDRWKVKCTDPDSFGSKGCNRLMEDMFQEFGQGINPYALDYPVCKEEGASPYKVRSKIESRKLSNMKLDPAGESVDLSGTATSSQVQALLNQTGQRGVENDATFARTSYQPCSMTYLKRYFDRSDVREAIHVRKSMDQGWEVCGGVNYSDQDVMIPTIALYQELVDRGKAGEHNLRMLVYSGDDDSICSTAGTQWWIWDLTGIDTMWKAWSAKDQTSGFATKFDMGHHSNATFSFVTVHGAGHEVPSYRPMEALELFRRYLNGIW